MFGTKYKCRMGKSYVWAFFYLENKNAASYKLCHEFASFKNKIICGENYLASNKRAVPNNTVREILRKII